MTAFAVLLLVTALQFCDAMDAAGKGLHRGQSYHWDVFGDVATAGGTLVETNTMPRTQFTITQGTLTVTEYGNSVPYTGKLDNLSKIPVLNIVKKALKNDAKKAFDTGAYDQFNTTLLQYVATTVTNTGTLYTDGTATGTNSVAMGKNHIKDIVDKMKERNIPPYTGDDYFAVAHPTTFRTLKNDLEAVHQYVDRGFDMILNGEIGRYEGCRFVEQTNIAKAAFTNSLSNQAFFFGEDTVMEGISIPEEMRGMIPGDFGRSMGVAWYYLGGFGIVHTTAAQVRIVKWASAA